MQLAPRSHDRGTLQNTRETELEVLMFEVLKLRRHLPACCARAERLSRSSKFSILQLLLRHAVFEHKHNISHDLTTVNLMLATHRRARTADVIRITLLLRLSLVVVAQVESKVMTTRVAKRPTQIEAFVCSSQDGAFRFLGDRLRLRGRYYMYVIGLRDFYKKTTLDRDLSCLQKSIRQRTCAHVEGALVAVRG